MKATLVQVRPETADVTSFIFEPERPLERVAGQFLRYILPHANMDERRDDRYFTIASAPFEKYLQITTRFAKRPSTFKQALQKLAIGAEIQIDNQAEGEFVVTDFGKRYIFVAGGIGITPIRSILADANHNEQKITAQVLYGNHDEQILFKHELDSFAERNSKLNIEYITDREGMSGKLLESAVASTDEPHVYLSGPEPMVEALTLKVKKLGLDIGHIQTDFFTGYESDQ